MIELRPSVGAARRTTVLAQVTVPCSASSPRVYLTPETAPPHENAAPFDTAAPLASQSFVSRNGSVITP